MDIRNPDIWDYHLQFYRIYHPTVDLFSQRKREREIEREREREQISHAMGYIFIILREITLKIERKMEILGRQIKDTRSLKRDNWVENKGKKRLKAKMKRNTAEIRWREERGPRLRKKKRVVELKKRGNQGQESWTLVWRLARGRWGRRFICLSRNVLHVSS